MAFSSTLKLDAVGSSETLVSAYKPTQHHIPEDSYLKIFAHLLLIWRFCVSQFSALSGWLVSDLAVSRTVLPSLDTETRQLSVGNYELPGVESYFWLAPEHYHGNLLTSYGSSVSFSVSWVVMRGDTSGRPTAGPNMVLIVSAAWEITVKFVIAAWEATHWNIMSFWREIYCFQSKLFYD
jgi:hypothetical protein